MKTDVYPYPIALTTVVCGWLLYGGCCGFITTLGSLSSTGLNIAINPFRTGAGAGGFVILCALFILLSVENAKSIMIHTSSWVKTRFTSIFFDLQKLASIDVIKATHNSSVHLYYQSWLPMNQRQMNCLLYVMNCNDSPFTPYPIQCWAFNLMEELPTLLPGRDNSC